MNVKGHDNMKNMILQMLNSERSHDDIHQELRKHGLEEEHIHSLVTESVKLRDVQRQTMGMNLILVGAAICLGSCIITLVSGTASMSNYSLIGLTSLGVVVVFMGLMKIF
ncbi:MAG: hypothetical protein EBZ77_12130 [Chitinophagia bacterium]|nr:hypothetical protein [Chitinophagia bacterium]